MFFLFTDCCGRKHVSEVPTGTPLPKNNEVCEICQDISWNVTVVSRLRARSLVIRKVRSSLLPGTAEAFKKEIRDEQARRESAKRSAYLKKEEARKRASFQTLIEYLDESLRVHRRCTRNKARR